MKNTNLEKTCNILKIVSFSLVQASILFLGAMLGFWVAVGMRKNEINLNQEVRAFQSAAIAFTVLFVIALISTGVTYYLYLRYKNKLEGNIDKTLKNLNTQKPTSGSININLNTVQPNNKPITSTPIQNKQPIINKQPVVSTTATPVKKVVTSTTTTTTRPSGPTPIVRPSGTPVRPTNGPIRPMGPTPMAARPSGTPVRPTNGPIRPMGPTPSSIKK